MHLTKRRFLAATALAVIAITALAPGADAHERRQVGSYVVVVGFDVEPAFVEDENAALIQVFRADGQPVEGVEKTLKVEVSTGGASRTFDLKPRPRQPGTYVAEFIPTKTGAYTFRFFGTIENQTVNERFESGPNRFDEVVSKGDLQFPAKVPSNGELAARLQQSRPSDGSPNAGAAGADDVRRALDRANSARTTGITIGAIGIVLGLAGVALGLYALTARRGGGSATRGEPEPI